LLTQQYFVVPVLNVLEYANIFFDFNYDAGVRNYMKTVHTRTWQHAVFHQSKEPPPFYPDESESVESNVRIAQTRNI